MMEDDKTCSCGSVGVDDECADTCSHEGDCECLHVAVNVQMLFGDEPSDSPIRLNATFRDLANNAVVDVTFPLLSRMEYAGSADEIGEMYTNLKSAQLLLNSVGEEFIGVVTEALTGFVNSMVEEESA